MPRETDLWDHLAFFVLLGLVLGACVWSCLPPRRPSGRARDGEPTVRRGMVLLTVGFVIPMAIVSILWRFGLLPWGS